MPDDVFSTLRGLARRGDVFDWDKPCVEIDDAALLIASQATNALSNQLKLSMTLAEWGRFKAILQSHIEMGLRHIVFEPPIYPGSP